MPTKTTPKAKQKAPAKSGASAPVGVKKPAAPKKSKATELSPREVCIRDGEWPRGVFCQITFDEICRRISSGEPLKPICREPGMPSWDTFYRWLHADDSRAQTFARAREVGEEAIASETLEIADDGRNDWMEKLDADGQPVGWQLNGEHVQRSKLRIETRLKLLAKWNPKKWGEKLQVDAEIKTPPDQVQSELLAKLTALQVQKGKDDNSGD